MLVSADKNTIDPPVYRIVANINSPIPIVPITRLDHYEFNPALLELKEYILIDYCEYGWDFYSDVTHLFGVNTEEFEDKFKGEEWQKFDNWVKQNPPKVYFKREMTTSCTLDYVKPIEYPNWIICPQVQTKEEFESKRPIDIFYFWGRSHEGRVMFHADIWKQSSNYGYSVCDNIYYLDGFLKKEENPKKWVSLSIPHFSRHDIAEVLAVNSLSKISVSMPGSGVKCFRSTGESPVNSVMAMPQNDIKWTFDWVHGENCILIRLGQEVKDLIANINRPELYNIYVNGVETARKYQWENYKLHIEKTIEQSI